MNKHVKIEKANGKWTVRAGGAVLGESTQALEVTEGDLPPVIYFPKSDIAMAFMDESSTVTNCPHKGDALHYSIQTKSALIEDAGWSYEAPIDDVSALKDHMAFYVDKVTVAQT